MSPNQTMSFIKYLNGPESQMFQLSTPILYAFPAFHLAFACLRGQLLATIKQARQVP